MDTSHKGTDPTSQGHETRDVDVRDITILAVVLLAAVGVSMALTLALFNVFDVREAERQRAPASLAGTPAAQPPEPRLQQRPTLDLNRMLAHEQARLDGWYWVNREAGLVGMPIEEAMARVVRRGLPSRPEASEEDAP